MAETGVRPILEYHEVGCRFGGITALDGVSFDVAERGIYGLIGPNGAGKTTLLNVTSGIVRSDSGEVRFRGRSISGMPSHRIASLGLARSFQNIRLFDELSVSDNVELGFHTRRTSGLFDAVFHLPATRSDRRRGQERMNALLDQLGLSRLKDSPAGALSYGDKRRVEIARALAADPRLLLLDEPAAGMNAVEAERLGEFLLNIRATGLTILLVEHHVDLIMAICDSVVVLNFGRKIAEGPPLEVRKDPAVVEAYLGAPAA